MGSESIRKFERMFPGIARDEKLFEQDLLIGSRTEAERNRQLRQKELSHNLNQGEHTIIGTYHYDFDNQTEIYTPAKSNKKK